VYPSIPYPHNKAGNQTLNKRLQDDQPIAMEPNRKCECSEIGNGLCAIDCAVLAMRGVLARPRRLLRCGPRALVSMMYCVV
jgi:hypothetical protein